MVEKKITTDDLRGMLNKYSREQQMEMDAKAVSEGAKGICESVKTICEGAKAIADTSAQIKECMDKLPVMVEELRETATLRITDEAKDGIVKAGKETGMAAARAFKEEVSAVIAESKRKTNNVTVPVLAAYCILTITATLLLFTSLMLFINLKIWHNNQIWEIALALGLIAVIAIASILYLNHKGWG